MSMINLTVHRVHDLEASYLEQEHKGRLTRWLTITAKDEAGRRQEITFFLNDDGFSSGDRIVKRFKDSLLGCVEHGPA